MAKKAQHIHQYERRTIGKKGTYRVYACRLPNCTHYLEPELVIGKLSVCPHCETAYQIERKHLQLVVPHCSNCKDENHPLVRKSETKDAVKVQPSLGQLFIDLKEKGNAKK